VAEAQGQFGKSEKEERLSLKAVPHRTGEDTAD
jgi:hypothetical protein